MTASALPSGEARSATWTNWATNYPVSGSMCLIVAADGKWQNNQCGLTLCFICQSDGKVLYTSHVQSVLD
jgi:hypothetical protein